MIKKILSFSPIYCKPGNWTSGNLPTWICREFGDRKCFCFTHTLDEEAPWLPPSQIYAKIKCSRNLSVLQSPPSPDDRNGLRYYIIDLRVLLFMFNSSQASSSTVGPIHLDHANIGSYLENWFSVTLGDLWCNTLILLSGAISVNTTHEHSWKSMKYCWHDWCWLSMKAHENPYLMYYHCSSNFHDHSWLG